MIFGLLYFCVVILCVNRSRTSFILYRIVKRHSRQSNVRRIWTCADNGNRIFICITAQRPFGVQIPRWVGRQDSVGPAPPFFDSGGPQTGVWWTKIEGEEFTDDMKIEFEPNKR